MGREKMIDSNYCENKFIFKTRIIMSFFSIVPF